MESKDILNLVLAVGVIVVASCFVYSTFYLVQALKSFISLSQNLDDAINEIREKLRLKALATIPIALISLISKLLKKRR